MLGDDRIRFCGQCSLNVYNLSSMTRADAEALIARTEGRLCVKFYRRFDGSIITQDCPIGLQAIKRRVSYAWQALVSVTLTFLAGFGIHQAMTSVPPFVQGRTVGVMARTEELDFQGRVIRREDSIPGREIDRSREKREVQRSSNARGRN